MASPTTPVDTRSWSQWISDGFNYYARGKVTDTAASAQLKSTLGSDPAVQKGIDGAVKNPKFLQYLASEGAAGTSDISGLTSTAWGAKAAARILETAATTEDFTNFTATARETGISAFRDHLKATPPAGRFAEIEKSAKFLDPAGNTRPFFDVINGLKDDKSRIGLQTAIGNAAVNDPKFLAEISAPGAMSGSMSPDKLKQALSDPRAAGYLTQALNNLGKEVPGPDGKPKTVGFDDFKKFTDDASAYSEAETKEWQDAQKKAGLTPEQIRLEREKRQSAALKSMGGVGVNPGLAGMTPDKMMGFLGKMFTDPAGALNDLKQMMAGSGMPQAQIEAISSIAGPMMHTAAAFSQPYREYWQVHGNTFKGYGQTLATAAGVDLPGAGKRPTVSELKAKIDESPITVAADKRPTAAMERAASPQKAAPEIAPKLPEVTPDTSPHFSFGMSP